MFDNVPPRARAAASVGPIATSRRDVLECIRRARAQHGAYPVGKGGTFREVASRLRRVPAVPLIVRERGDCFPSGDRFVTVDGVIRQLQVPRVAEGWLRRVIENLTVTGSVGPCSTRHDCA